RPATARGELLDRDYGKNNPLRSLPISANELDDVASGSDSYDTWPTCPVHSIFATLRTNSPAKPPPSNGESVFLMFTRWFTPRHSTVNDTVAGVPEPNRALPKSPYSKTGRSSTSMDAKPLPGFTSMSSP